MPGNEVGDRVHNFFEQSSLSQERHNQALDGSWPVVNNNLWAGNERQISGPLTPSSKNYNLQQSDVERGQGNQFSLNSHGLNFPESNLRSEFVKNPAQLQQLNLSGFMHSPQVVHTRQNETNFLGVDTEPDRHNLTSRGLSFMETQQRSIVQRMNSASFGGSESPMNFNFLGGQQQMSGQQQGMLQSFPRHQSAVGDAQLFQQQVMLKQMQEMQRQNQQLQLEAMQRNALSQMSNFPNQMGGQHSPAINGNPFHEASNYPWQSQVMAGNTNWAQGGLSAMQGYSNGVMITPEQGQALRLMGLIPQQAPQSLYGVPVTNSRTANPLSQNNTDKSGGLQLSTPDSSFSGNQYASLMEKAGMQDGNTVSRSGSEGKAAFEHASGGSFRNVVNPGSFDQLQQRSVASSEGGREDSAGGSELLPEKSVAQATSSQDAAGLDPTEAKILFGNDESIWEAFGGSSHAGTGGGGRLDGADLFGGSSCMQSGTWSALMQSAVAETSSSDVGMQEEWSGLGSQDSRTQSGSQHPSLLRENEKQPVWLDSSQRASLVPHTSNNDVSAANYLGSSGLSHPSPKQATEVLQTENQIPQEGVKWLDRNLRKPQAELHRSVENAISRNSSKTDNAFWSHQPGSFLNDNHGKPSKNAMGLIESMPANDGVASSNQDDFHDQGQTMRMSMNAGHGGAMRFESLPASNVKMGNPQVNSLDLGAARGNPESSQKLPDGNHIDLWKPVNSSVKSGNFGSGNDQQTLNNGPPILESSGIISGERGDEMHEAKNSSKREDSSDGHQPNIPYHSPPGGLRENLWSDAGDRSSLFAGREKSSDQAGQKAPVARKFQYHPMGDADMDSESYASKQVLHPQAVVLKNQETHPQFHSTLGTNSSDIKGRVSDVHGAIKPSHGISSSGTPPGYFPNTSAPFARSGELSSNQHVSSSQNMLELLNKVDQSREQNIGSAGLGQSQPSTSHGFSLQLGPPSQRATPSNLHVSQISSRPIGSPSSDQTASDKGDKTHAWLTAVSSQMRPGNNVPGIVGTVEADGSPQNQKGRLLGPLSSGSSYLRNPLQNQHVTAAGGKMVTDQSTPMSFDNRTLHDRQNNDSQEQAAAAASQSQSNSQNIAPGRYMNQSGMRAFMHQVLPGLPGKDNQLPSQQQLWGVPANNASDLQYSQFPPNGALETSSLPHDKRDEQDGARMSSQGTVGGNEAQAAEAPSSRKIASASVEESLTRHPLDASSNSAASQKHYEELHNSFKSNIAAQHNYALRHQMLAMKNKLTDPSQRESKRLKVPDNDPDSQAAQPLSGDVNNVVHETLDSQIPVSSEDAKEPKFSSQAGNRNASTQFSHGTVASQDVFPFARGESQNFSAVSSGRGEHAGISPQMAPSWFEKYGTFKNGQLLTAHNVPRVPVTKNVELISSGKSPSNLIIHSSAQNSNSAADTGLMGNLCQTTSSYTVAEHDSDGLVPHVPMPALASKKRKTATSDLLPWNKEIGQGFKRLQNISSAEIDWAKSSNRLAEKVEHETDPSEDLLSMIRPKRRLLLTTRLMQQVFRPPSTPILSLKASSNYETVVFSLARLVLGDACSLVCCTEGDLPIHLDSCSIRSEKVRAPERIRDQYFAKVIEDLSNRAKELENDLIRLDKRTSILDFRLDCQDLERFAVINRFARFHGRGQVDGAETSTSSSSSSDAAVVAQRACPQRYVSALPMPKNIPERVQCLSL